MGGLVTRYALTFMEQQNPPLKHNAKMFFTMDTPHQGAEISPSVQFQVENMANKNPSAALLLQQFISNSAKQMLYYNATSGSPYVDKIHTDFYNTLQNMGYPKGDHGTTGFKIIGVSNGAGNGAKIFDDGVQTLKWNATCNFAGGTGYMLPVQKTSSFQTSTFWYFSTQPIQNVTNLRNYDNAPGGQINANQQLVTDLIAAGMTVTALDSKLENSCFIPIMSSLDITGSTSADPQYDPVLANGEKSPFHEYYRSDTINSGHVEITEDIKNFLLQYLPAVNP